MAEKRSHGDFPFDDAYRAAMNLQRTVTSVINELAREVVGENATEKTRDVWPFTPPPPAMDLQEDEEAITVELDIPGVPEETLDVTLNGQKLTITGERPEPTPPGEGGRKRRSERAYGRFRRDIALPDEVEADGVEAIVRGGVLTVRLPKVKAAPGHKIHVKKESPAKEEGGEG